MEGLECQRSSHQSINHLTSNRLVLLLVVAAAVLAAGIIIGYISKTW